MESWGAPLAVAVFVAAALAGCSGTAEPSALPPLDDTSPASEKSRPSPGTTPSTPAPPSPPGSPPRTPSTPGIPVDSPDDGGVAPKSSKSFVVIAIVDTGINAYHMDFRRPEMTEHPSTYIPGFPTDARALDLTLGAEVFPAADQGTIDGVECSSTGEPPLYWIPGTNIIGAKCYSPDVRPILDDNGHGTAVASVAAGNGHGSCPECLLVFLEGLGAYDWALKQTWIDVVSNSYGYCDPLLCALSTPAPRYVLPGPGPESSEAGQVVLFSAGNGLAGSYDVPQLTYQSVYTGPDWVVAVGAVDPFGGHDFVGHGKPVDIVSYGHAWPAATHTSLEGEDDFGGTSCASPVAAGSIGKALLAARREMGDVVGGHEAGVVARGTPGSSPMLEDGELTRAELMQAVTSTALYPTALVPHYVLPTQAPATAADPLLMGWGLVDAVTADQAIQVIVEGVEPPAKPAVATAWMPVHSQVRQGMYGSWSGGSPGSAPAPVPADFEDVLRLYAESTAGVPAS